MSLFEVGTAIEDVIGNLKQCLQRRDFLRFNLKAKTMIVRYDNPLIIAYSEELDDEELIRLALETLQYCSKNEVENKDKTIRLLGDIVAILARRPMNLKKLVEYRVMDILLDVIKDQPPEEVVFVVQILTILIILLEYDDIRAIPTTRLILSLILEKVKTFSLKSEIPNRDFVCQCVTIMRFCVQRDELFKLILRGTAKDDGVDLMKWTVNTYGDKNSDIVYNCASVINQLLEDTQAAFKMIENNFTTLLTRLLTLHFGNEQAALSLSQSLRKLVPFKKSREEAQKINLPDILRETILRHQQGNLTIVQFSFMCLVILATSVECRDVCRKVNSVQTIVKCMETYSTNSAVVRDSCIAIASLIYCPEFIDQFAKFEVARGFLKGCNSLAAEDHKITLRVLASAYKEASLYDQCIDNLLKHNAVTALINLLNYQYADKTIVSLVMAALVRLSFQGAKALAQFKGDNISVVIPTIISRYVDVNWIITRNALIMIKALGEDDGVALSLIQKEGYKQVVRAMVHYLKNCKSIVLISLEILLRFLKHEKGPAAMKDERVIKAITITEQRFHKKSRQISTAARECLKILQKK